MDSEVKEIHENISAIKSDISEIKRDFKAHEVWEEGFLVEAFAKTNKLIEDLNLFKKKYADDKEEQAIINGMFQDFRNNTSLHIKVLLIGLIISYVCILTLFIYVRSGLA